MNKNELARSIAQRSNLSIATSQKAISALADVITETLAKGESVVLPGFGSFSIAERAARTSRNPRTGETIEVAASKAPKFKAGKNLKEAVNG